MKWLTLLFMAALSGCAASQTAPPPETPAEGREDERRAYRRAVGGLAAGYLFQAHLSIGTTADLLGKQVYAPEEVEALMDTTIGMGENVREMLRDVKQVELGPGDARTIERMLEVNRLLSAQADALKAFAHDRTRDNALRFDQHRQSTWAELKRLLKLPPQKP